MSVFSKKMREERVNLAARQQEILAAAESRADGMTTEERTEFDRIHTRQEELRADIERIEAAERTAAELAESRGVVAGRRDTADVAGEEQRKAETHRLVFEAYVRGGTEYMSPEQRSILAEYRAQTTQTDSTGGYLVPEGFASALEKAEKAFGGAEAAGTSFSTESGNPLPWPTVNDTANSGRLLAENAAVTTTDVTLGAVTFGAYKWSSDIVLVPSELLQDSAFDLDVELPMLLGERLGRAKNGYYTTGTGSSQPQGVVTGSTAGKTAASATAITYLELIDLMHSVDPAYRMSPKCGWQFNDGTLAAIKKLVDSEGRPLWSASIREGEPDLLLGKPFTVNQSMASIATAAKTVLFGDFGKFRVRNVRGVVLRRLTERYADNDQVGFIAFERSDSKVLNAGTNPIKHLVQA